jgi:hypothetical protein
LGPALDSWQPREDWERRRETSTSKSPRRADRALIFQHTLAAERELRELLRQPAPGKRVVLPGIDLRPAASFNVSNVRLARRIGGQGEFRTEMIAEVVQSLPAGSRFSGPAPYRGGATLVIDLRTWQIRYLIYKRLYEQLPTEAGQPGVPTARLERQQRAAIARSQRSIWNDGAGLARSLSATYADSAQQAADEPFALLHRSLE